MNGALLVGPVRPPHATARVRMNMHPVRRSWLGVPCRIRIGGSCSRAARLITFPVQSVARRCKTALCGKEQSGPLLVRAYAFQHGKCHLRWQAALIYSCRGVFARRHCKVHRISLRLADGAADPRPAAIHVRPLKKSAYAWKHWNFAQLSCDILYVALFLFSRVLQ